MEKSLEEVELRTEPASDADPEELRLDSVTLARLLAEVRNDVPVEANAYNRMHNRHNR